MSTYEKITILEFLNRIDSIKNEEDIMSVIRLIKSDKIIREKRSRINQSLRTAKDKNVYLLHKDVLEKLIKNEESASVRHYLYYNLLYAKVKPKFNNRIIDIICDHISDITSKHYMEQCYQSTL